MTELVFGVRPKDFDDDYRRDVCRIGQGEECCRYLTMGAGGWSCEKTTSLKYTLDNRAATGQMVAKGDNCGGCFEVEPAFKLLKDRVLDDTTYPKGSIIYRCKGYDYGLASDDEFATGIPHTSMTLDPSGGYPSFTVPNTDFEPVD